MRRPLLLGILLLAARVASADSAPPVIEHVPVTRSAPGRTITLSAKITDESETFAPTLYFRAAGAKKWSMRGLTPRGGRFEAELEVNGDVEYWLEVYDEYGNGPTQSGSDAKPHRVTVKAEKAAAPAADTAPPLVTHTPVERVRDGEPVEISAHIVDPSGVFAPTLYHRAPGTQPYTSLPLTGTGGTYAARVAAPKGLEYWLEAYDELGNGPTRRGTPEAPYVVRAGTPSPSPEPVVQVTPAALPVQAPESSETTVEVFDPMRTAWIVGGAAVGGALVAGTVAAIMAAQQPDYGRLLVVTDPGRRR